VAEEVRKREADRTAAEEARKREADRVAVEEARKREADRIAVEEARKREADRVAVEEARKREADRIAAEEARKREADRLAAEEARRREAERLAAEDARRREAERLATEAARAREAERIAAEDARKREAERQAAADGRRRDAQRLSDEQARQAGSGPGAGGGGAGVAPGPRTSGQPGGGDLASRARDAVRGLDLLGRPSRALEERVGGPRRVTAGRVIRDIPLRMYVESWKAKIERNGNLNYSSLKRVRIDPVVVVAIRADGSVEEISFARSSGRPEVDEAVRRIVRLNARYSVFPPNIAANYDVIEIRRVWSFDDELRLIEEVD